jgi:hypothetical protein
VRQYVNGLRTNTVAVTATGSWSISRWGWQFFSSEAVDEAYVPFFGAFGAAWTTRWSPAGAPIRSGCCGGGGCRFAVSGGNRGLTGSGAAGR